MTIKKVTSALIAAPCMLLCLPAQDPFQETPALGYATALAAGHGTGLSLHIFSPAVASPFPITTDAAFDWPEWENTREANLVSSTARAAATFIEQAGIDLFETPTRLPLERPGASFLHLARVHDLTILDAGNKTERVVQNAIEDALFDSGSPVLLIPASYKPVLPRCIVIAWDGSTRSARAVKDALPLLGMAETVVAVTVTGDRKLSKTAPGAHLVSYLACHGIDCRFVTLEGREGDAADHLRQFVAGQSADLLVMGAFVHSRWREAVVGGVTRAFLDDCSLPLFMAH